MSHPVEVAAEALIARLRQHREEIPMPSDGEVFLPGLWGSFDAQEGALSGRLRAGEGALLRVALSVERTPRWCTLALALGDQGLAEGCVIGLVADLRANRTGHVELMLRSVSGGQNRDVRFDDGLELSPEGGPQAALLAVPPGSVLSEPNQRLRLLLGLPRSDIEFEIRDMRLFVLPASGAGPAGPDSRPDSGPGTDPARPVEATQG